MQDCDADCSYKLVVLQTTVITFILLYTTHFCFVHMSIETKLKVQNELLTDFRKVRHY